MYVYCDEFNKIQIQIQIQIQSKAYIFGHT